MRYELSDHEWAVRPMLPNKPRGVPRVNDRRVLNGICWVLRSGAPWRDLPEGYGPPTTCYNRFVRWRLAGVWGMSARFVDWMEYGGPLSMVGSSQIERVPSTLLQERIKVGPFCCYAMTHAILTDNLVNAG